MPFLLVVAGCARVVFAAPGQTDPTQAVKSFSDFQQIDLNRVENGDILSVRGALMDFPNGISAQTCFVMPVSAEEAAKRLQSWSPAPHTELKVYAYHMLQAPCTLADFQSLNFNAGGSSAHWLLDKSVATSPTQSELNLSREEARKLADCTQRRSDPAKVSACWADLLFARASAFQQKGLAAVQSYDVYGPTISPGDQLRSMLREQLSVSHEFLPILKKIGLLENNPDPSLVPTYYWTLFDADYHGTISLGGIYQLPVGDHFQLVDLEYYVNANYYTSVTLFEVWPIDVKGKSEALVWRGDYFAAPLLRFTKGTERIAYGLLMLQDIKKEIHDMQEDAKAGR